MRIPVPRNTLVALTLAGALLVALASVGLAYPSLLPGGDDAPADAPADAADAPTPNPNFTPTVQSGGTAGDSHEAHEEGEHENDEHGGDEREGYEDD